MAGTFDIGKDLSESALLVIEKLFREKSHWQTQCNYQTEELSKLRAQLLSMTKEKEREAASCESLR